MTHHTYSVTLILTIYTYHGFHEFPAAYKSQQDHPVVPHSPTETDQRFATTQNQRSQHFNRRIAVKTPRKSSPESLCIVDSTVSVSSVSVSVSVSTRAGWGGLAGVYWLGWVWRRVKHGTPGKSQTTFIRTFDSPILKFHATSDMGHRSFHNFPPHTTCFSPVWYREFFAERDGGRVEAIKVRASKIGGSVCCHSSPGTDRPYQLLYQAIVVTAAVPTAFASMAWVFWALATAAAGVALTMADGGGYGALHAPAPVYHAPVHSYHPPPPPPVSYAPISIYSGSSGGKKGGGKRGNLFNKGLRGGFSLFGGKGKGRGKGSSGRVIAPVHIPAPPPLKQHHVLNVKVPQCHPLTHYVTQYVTEAHPVPQVHTEYVENVVPSILYKTKHERLVETSIVTDVVRSIITVTHTTSVPVTRYSSVTEVVTQVETSSVYQTTVEVSYTPVYRTKVLTETQTITQVESVPDVQVSLVTKSIYLPPTDYITVTEPRLIPSPVLTSAVQHYTVHPQSHHPPVHHAGGYGSPAVTVTVKEPVYQEVTTTVYRQNYVTHTEYQTQVVTQTNYQDVTQVVTEYVTIRPDCGGGSYGSGRPSVPLDVTLHEVSGELDDDLSFIKHQVAPRLYGSDCSLC
ncbi:uncharacterized protein LOC135107112 [Scylla paramamosain]|uniref:uncharacterized protein LOC135107112 n=1 Tax=Scylla paramamosain TaxID=85552 RepID=UPI00308366CE